MTRVRQLFARNIFTRRLQSTRSQMLRSRAMEFEDLPEDGEAEESRGSTGNSGTSSAKPRSKMLMALDEHFGASGNTDEIDELPAQTHQQKPISSVSRAQQPRSIPYHLSFFDPKPIPRQEQSTIKVASAAKGSSNKPPSVVHASALRGSSNSNSIKPASSSKPYSKSGGSTKVQVNLPLYSYRDKRFSEPSPIPKRIYVRNMDQANDLVSKLDTSGALGFDLEWRVIFRSKAPPRPTAVLQICDKSMILVIQLSSMAGQFPPKLRAVLEDRSVPKLGVNILNDGIRIGNDFGFRPHALLELGGLARQADPGPKGYIEKYFRVTNPDYVETYLASLDKAEAVPPEDDEMSSEKENGSPATPEEESPDPSDNIPKGNEAISNKPRKPGAMIALATITAMYTGRTLNKGPVRSSNWEKDPLSEAQLEYAANDAHCALVVYERLMNLARENKVTLDSEKYMHDVKWFHVKKKPESSGVQGTRGSTTDLKESLSISSFTIPTPAPPSGAFLPLYADDDVPLADPSTLNAQGTGGGKAPRAVKQRPQHIRSYNLWFGKNMALDEMCKTLRSPDNPLKIGTVISYVVGALQADPSLRFSYEKIKVLLESEKASFERHKLWFEALNGMGNIHVNMTREIAELI